MLSNSNHPLKKIRPVIIIVIEFKLTSHVIAASKKYICLFVFFARMVVLELLRLDEICVLLQVSLVHVIHDLPLPHGVLQHGLAFVETCP